MVWGILLFRHCYRFVGVMLASLPVETSLVVPACLACVFWICCTTHYHVISLCGIARHMYLGHRPC
jgi:hypothetical protein